MSSIVRVTLWETSCLNAIRKRFPKAKLLSLSGSNVHDSYYNSDSTQTIAHFEVKDRKGFVKGLETGQVRCRKCGGECLLEVS